jgi:hypothetical protein
MSPLDDELRALFHRRADVLAPAADPMAGIELRAKRMRRNRVAASVAGTALAVTAIAIAVPVLRPDSHGQGSQFAPPGPSAPATLRPSPGDGLSLDPQHPWAYRGDPSLIAGNELTTLQAEWATAHPGSTLSPLFGQVYEPSQKPEIAFVATSPGGSRWGVATSSHAGWVFPVDEALSAPTPVLMAVLAGDGAPRLIVIAGPRTGAISYAVDGVSFHEYPGPLVGVVFVPLQGDTSRDAVQVLDGNGNIDAPLFEGPAPDPATSASPSPGAKPVNYIEWQTRGTVDPAVEAAAVNAFAAAVGTPDAVVGHHVLFGGKDSAGRSLVFMQAWYGAYDGGQGHSFGFVSDGKGGGEPFLGPVTTQDPPVLAYLVSAAPGRTTDTLVLLPRLGAGAFSYATSATAPYRTVGSGRSDLANVAMIDRDPRATSDRVKVLQGDGSKLFEGPVMPLLCGATSCG